MHATDLSHRHRQDEIQKLAAAAAAHCTVVGEEAVAWPHGGPNGCPCAARSNVSRVLARARQGGIGRGGVSRPIPGPDYAD
jgi:hypothetical protein